MRSNRPYLTALLISAVLLYSVTAFATDARAGGNDPAVRVFVFAQSVDHAVWYRMYDKFSQSWQPWATLGGSIKGDPASCSPSLNTVTVFVRGKGGPGDNELFSRNLILNKTPKPWRSFHTKIGSDPAAVCRPVDNTHVFARGFENPYEWHAWSEEGVWANLFSTGDKSTLFPEPGIGGENFGGKGLFSPGAASSGGQRLDIFARKADGYIWHKSRDGGGNWHDWDSLGGVTMESTPAAASRSTLDVSVFVRGANGQLWTKMYRTDLDKWGPWLPVGLKLSGKPAAVRTAANRIDLFARGDDDTLLHSYVTYKNNIAELKSVPPWETLAGQLTSDPSAVAPPW